MFIVSFPEDPQISNSPITACINNKIIGAGNATRKMQLKNSKPNADAYWRERAAIGGQKGYQAVRVSHVVTQYESQINYST